MAPRNFAAFFTTHLLATQKTQSYFTRLSPLLKNKEVIMSGNLNKAMVIGYLGKDPEVRSFQNGGRAASLSIGSSESWKDKASGQRKERTEWHRVSILSDGLVTVAEKYLKKGGKVYVEGKLETRKWTDRDGIERYTTEIVLRPYSGELILLDRKDETAVAAPDDDNPAPDDAEAELAEPARASAAR
jgi:single-strand DNA-binding protein